MNPKKRTRGMPYDKPANDEAPSVKLGVVSFEAKPGLVGLCDSRPPSDTEPRYYSLNVHCVCDGYNCVCQGRPHSEYLAKEGLRTELHEYALKGKRCSSCDK